MAAEGPTTVGEIIGYLRLDASQWDREMTAAGRKADQLDRKNVRVKITTNAAEAVTKIAAADRALAALTSRNEQVKRSAVSLSATQRALANAIDSVSQAEARVNRTRAAGGGAPTERQTLAIAAAEQQLSRAMRSRETAAERVGLAEQKLASDTAKAAEAHRRLGSEADKASGSVDKMGKSAERSHGKVSLLGTAIVALGPAVVPLAGIAAAGFGAVAAGAGVAVLAVKGIGAEMKANTVLGRAYGQQLGTLKTDLAGLEHTAAASSFGGISKATGDLHRLMPQLNADTRTYSGLLADAGQHGVHGITAGFLQLRPLIQDILTYADQLAGSFDRYASGGGIQKFADWARGALPQVEKDIEAIATAVAHLIAAGGTSGLSVLNLLGDLARVIDSIPIGTLQVLVPLLSEVYLAAQAFKGLRAATQAIGSFAGSGGLGKMIVAAPIAAAALYALNQRLIENQRIQQQNADQQVQFTDALREDGGVFGQHSLQVAATSTEYTKVSGALAAAGLSMKDLSRYLSGNTKGFTEAQMSALKFVDAGGLAVKGQDSLTDSLRRAEAAQKAANEAAALAAKQAADAHPEYARTAAALGTTVGKYLAADAAAKQEADALAAATLQMQRQSDAAGLLDGALNRLGGNNLGVAEATTQAILATKEATKSFRDNGTAIAGNSDKALANQAALQRKACTRISRSLRLSGSRPGPR
jgi:hypothetical protein